MTSNDLYKKYLLKINKNDTNSNVNISKGEFVLIFNEEKRSWLNDKIIFTQSSDLQEIIQELLVTDYELTKVDDFNNRSSFQVPTDLFKSAYSYSLASKGTCTNKRLTNWMFKVKNINVLLEDTNNKPSFEYEETLALFGNNTLQVFKDGFSVDRVFLTYYKEPVDIDLAGYVKIDGTNSTQIDPNLSDKNLEEILNRCVVTTSKNYKDIEATQLNNTRNTL